MIDRPPYAMITRVQEGTESQVIHNLLRRHQVTQQHVYLTNIEMLCDFFEQIFKLKFTGWDEVIAVDFTRTAESVQRTGADLTKWARKQETKVVY